MTSTRRILTLAGAAAGLALLAGFAGGCGMHRHPRDPAEVASFVASHVDDALDNLDATPTQRQQIHAIADKLVKDGVALHAGQADARKALVAQWDSAQPNRDQIHALIDQRIEALRAFAYEAADSAVDVHGILSPDQRAKVSKKIHRHADVH